MSQARCARWAWAKRRFPQSAVSYCVGDLFETPAEWRGGYDLVHELYTLQALPEALLPRAARALASLVAPGGTLLVIARARDASQVVEGPPWPLTRENIEALAVDGLRLDTLEDIPPRDELAWHWRASFRRGAVRALGPA
ncbi:MAG: TPMT family class I SAM-dependent methyltransferase [Methylocystis sp.]|nr:TPMT family class I SAM-dependent methyltransferase [Methylocystis sp.]